MNVAATPTPLAAVPSLSVPAGFAPVFAGWNVWDLYQADEPDESILGSIWHAGESQDRLLRVWVEDNLRDNAPGTAVADPANPTALSGDPVQPIPSAGGLVPLVTRSSVPTLAGALQLGTADSTAALHTVRFYNRGAASVMPWPHDGNFVLDAVYTPSASNPITNAPAPTTLAGSASAAADAIGHGLETLAWVAAGAAAVFILLKLAGRSRS